MWVPNFLIFCIKLTRIKGDWKERPSIAFPLDYSLASSKANVSYSLLVADDLQHDEYVSQLVKMVIDADSSIAIAFNVKATIETELVPLYQSVDSGEMKLYKGNNEIYNCLLDPKLRLLDRRSRLYRVEASVDATRIALKELEKFNLPITINFLPLTPDLSKYKVNIKWLELQEELILNGMDRLVAALRTNSALEKLDLSSCFLKDNDVEQIFAALSTNESLKTLRLNETGISSAIQIPLSFTENKGLRELKLEFVNLGEIGVLHLLDRLPANLASLHLRENNIPVSPEVTKSLVNLIESNTSLQELHWGNHYNMDVVLAVTKALQKNQVLEIVCLLHVDTGYLAEDDMPLEDDIPKIYELLEHNYTLTQFDVLEEDQGDLEIILSRNEKLKEEKRFKGVKPLLTKRDREELPSDADEPVSKKAKTQENEKINDN